MKENIKVRSCREHLIWLADKNMQTFEIEGYNFISTVQDAFVFEERKMLTQRGKGNLTILGTSCESERVAALEAIENAKGNVLKSVENRFEEMKVVVTAICNEVKNQLAQLEVDMENFLLTENNQLSPTALLLCSDMGMQPRLVRFGIADVSDDISAMLSDSWIIAPADIDSTLACLDATQKIVAVEHALAEATDFAQRGISDALLYADSLIGERPAFEEEKTKVLSELLKVEKMRIERNTKWLQRTWDLGQRYAFDDRSIFEVGQKLARILSRQLGQFSQAEGILKHCFEIAYRESPVSELSMSLCIDISEVYFASARRKQLDELALWILDAVGAAHLSADHYWTTLLFITYSKRLERMDQEAISVFERWWESDFPGESRFAEMLRLLTCGMIAFWKNHDTEAEKSFLQAKRIGITHFPTSPFTALSIARLALVSEESTREQYHQAQIIYEVVSPMSVLAAFNHGNQSNFFKKHKEWKGGEAHHQQALSILEIIAPKSIDAASSLYSLATLYFDMKKWKEAEDCHRKAQSILKDVAPKSIIAADNLSELGILLHQVQRWEEEEECYREALSILEDVTPKSTKSAIIFYNLGNLLKEREQWSVAEGCYREARSIFEITEPQGIDAARNMTNLGVLFHTLDAWAEAEECYEQAQSIYQHAGPKSVESAHTYYLMGQLFETTMRIAEGIECFEKAASIYGNDDPVKQSEAEAKALMLKKQ